MNQRSNYPVPTWKSAPKTLTAAIKRIEDLQHSHQWASEEAVHAREWGEKGWAETQRLGRLLTYRAKVGDANASCPHANTEVGQISGNTYCSDCQETLAEVNRHLAQITDGKASP